MSTLPPIAVRFHGKGTDTVIVLHGGPGAPGSAASLATALADEFHVLEPWQRTRTDAPLSVAGHVKDLAAIAPAGAAVVGWSWGAMLALSYASAHPELVAGIVLVGCGTYDTASRARYHDAVQQALEPDERGKAAQLHEALASEDDPDKRNALWGALGTLMESTQSVDELPEPDGEATFDEHGAHETWHDVLRLQAERIEPQRFSAIRCPVSMLHGAQDPHPGPATRDTLLQHLPQLEYVEFDRCAHRPWLERDAHEAFLDALRARLRTWLS